MLYHCNLHLNFNADDSIWHGALTSGQVLLTIFGSWGQVGVDCFVLISAYFLVDSDGAKGKNMVKISLQTVFYSILTCGILIATDIEDYSVILFIKNAMSSLLGGYWFILPYCLMYVTAPYLNIGIRGMNNKQLRNIAAFLVTLTVILIGLLRRFSSIGTYTWFVALYLLMAYLKRNSDNLLKKYCRLGCITCFTVNLAIILIFMKINGDLASKVNGLFHIGSPFILAQSLFLFYVFETRRQCSVRIINCIADCSLGVYLFHENYALYANENNTGLIWDSIFGIGKSLCDNDTFFILRYLLAVLAVFAAGLIVDLLRKNLLERPLFRLRIFKVFCNKLDEIIN